MIVPSDGSSILQPQRCHLTGPLDKAFPIPAFVLELPLRIEYIFWMKLETTRQRSNMAACEFE